MGSPNLTIDVEPSDSGKVAYLPLAPEKKGANSLGRLMLRITVTNHENKQVTINKLTISFGGQPQVSSVAIPTKFSGGSNWTVKAGKGGEWWFQTPDQNVIIPSPAPKEITLALSCKGFSQPAQVTLPLVPHRNSTPQGDYLFPGKASDHRLTEYRSTGGDTHGVGAEGSQSFAYDIGVIGFDSHARKWTSLLPGTTGEHNADYRVWGKPVYAMADGVVLDALNNCPNNPTPLDSISDKTLRQKANDHQKQLWKPFPFGGAGNHYYIQHGQEVMLYAHLQKGSLPAAAAKPGVHVKAGQFLGLAGNSGNSTAPHTHIHAIKGTKPEKGPLRPILFRDAFAVERSALDPPDPAGPWVKMNKDGIPAVSPVEIWPAATKPAWYPPGWVEVGRHGIPESEYQTEFEHVVSSGYRPVWIDGYDVKGNAFFNVIFRPADGTAWHARHGLSARDYQKEFEARTKKDFRLLQIESYISSGDVRYAPIFVHSPGPKFTAYHGKNSVEHQKLFNDLTKAGWRPINISVVSLENRITVAALYEKRDVGSFVAESALPLAQYQAEFEKNEAAGRKLVYLNGFTHNRKPHISAIWHQHAESSSARHGMTSAQYQAQYGKELRAGRLTRVVTGYQQGTIARFAAFWSK